MRAIVHASDRVNHLLLAMAADAAAAATEIEWVDRADDLLVTLADTVRSPDLPDVVLVVTDRDAEPLDAVAAIDAELPWWPTPIVVASADPSEDERLRAYACGADWYLPLPQAFSDIVDLLEFLPSRAMIAARIVDGPGLVDQAALDLVEEIESFLAA
jgi:DNA-binding NarL/FixJ family response regulator